MPQLFNKNPKKSLDRLVGMGFLTDATDAKQIAEFARHT